MSVGWVLGVFGRCCSWALEVLVCLCAVSRYLHVGVSACWYMVYVCCMCLYGGVCEHGSWVFVSVCVDVWVLEV